LGFIDCRVDRNFLFKRRSRASLLSLVSSFHLKRDTDETRARVRKGAARTKSERESSRSRATVSPPLSRPSSKRRREKAFCLFGETRFIRFK
jgi:hypothetical protein